MLYESLLKKCNLLDSVSDFISLRGDISSIIITPLPWVPITRSFVFFCKSIKWNLYLPDASSPYSRAKSLEFHLNRSCHHCHRRQGHHLCLDTYHWLGMCLVVLHLFLKEFDYFLQIYKILFDDMISLIFIIWIFFSEGKNDDFINSYWNLLTNGKSLIFKHIIIRGFRSLLDFRVSRYREGYSF